MKGKMLSEFIDELFINPEMELICHNTKYLISGYLDKGLYTLSVNILGSDCIQNVFEVTNLNRNECVAKFEKTKIFDGLTIYEVEQDIEVLYG